MRLLTLLFLLLAFQTVEGAEKSGRLVNPISDVCWECLFPITVAGVNTTPNHPDFVKYKKRICSCAGVPPKIGIPVSFWEPLRLIDVTRHAYRLVGLGGIQVGEETVKNRGSVGIIGDGPSQNSFYQVHVYYFPVIALLGLFGDFACLDRGDIEVPYMSELDPTWKDDRLAIIFNPEAALFGNPLAQTACVADCLASSSDHPKDELFWCAGCHGSLYPLTGTVAHHCNSLQATSLLLHRAVAKMHKLSLIKGFDKNDFCDARYMPIIKKTLYKTQLVFPVAHTKGKCPALGKSDLLWGRGKPLPIDDESFCYLLWSKKQCCLDAVKPVVTGGGL